jgi:hypothetical protein
MSPWFRVDAGLARHPKIIGLPRATRWAHVEALCYAAEYGGDEGRIPAAAARTFATPAEVAALLDAGLWERNGAGYVIHDWADYQSALTAIERRRAADAERQRRRRDHPDVT